MGRSSELLRWQQRGHELPTCQTRKGKTRARRIDFRHVIDSLAKSPVRSAMQRWRNDILPDDEWRRLWRRLCNHLEPDMAGRLMVHALKLAAGYDDISVVAKGMEQMLDTRETWICTG